MYWKDILKITCIILFVSKFEERNMLKVFTVKPINFEFFRAKGYANGNQEICKTLYLLLYIIENGL